MITKITNGNRPGDLAAYLHGPGRQMEHEYGREPGGAVIGGTLGRDGDRDGRGWAVDLREAAATRPDIAKPIWHMSVRSAPGDRSLSDSEWADVAHEMGTSMGWADKPYVVVRHGGDHVHIVVSRVGDDGAVWNRRDDRYKARRAANAVEKRLGLTVTPERSSEKTARRPDHQLTQGEHRKAMHEGVTPPRVQLAERVRAARDAATGRGRDGFETALEQAGVQFRANVAKTGTVSGYSFHLPGNTDATGQDVWWKASQLDKTLSWRQLGPVLDQERRAPAVDVPKKFLESSARHEQRVTAALQEAQAAETARALEAVPAVVASADHQDARWWTDRQAQNRDRFSQTLHRALEAAKSYLETVEAVAYSRVGRSVSMAARLAWAEQAEERGQRSSQASQARPYMPPQRRERGPSIGR